MALTIRPSNIVDVLSLQGMDGQVDNVSNEYVGVCCRCRDNKWWALARVGCRKEVVGETLLTVVNVRATSPSD